MGVRPGRCHACGETGAGGAQFCGHCGAHLPTGNTGPGSGPRRTRAGAAGPHSTPAATGTGDRTDGTGARRPAWWLAAGAAAAVVAVAAALTGGLPATGGRSDEVSLPDEAAVGTDADPGPRVDRGAPPVTPADAEFDCLVDEPCVRWRSDVDGLLDGRHRARTVNVGGHTLLVHAPHGVAGLDLAGRVRWSRTTSEGEVLSTTREVTATDEHAVLSTEQGRLHVLEVRSGEHRWVAEQPSPIELDGGARREEDVAGRSPPDAGGRDAAEHLRLVSAREYGEVLLLAFEERRPYANELVPAHHLVAYGLHDGTPRWQRRVARAALVHGTVVAATGAGTVGLDPRTGGVRWTREDLGGDRASPRDVPGGEPPPMPHRAAIPVGVLGGRVIAVTVPAERAMETVLLDPATGRERARLEGSPLPHAVAGYGADDRLVLRRGDGGRELLAVDADGRVQWERRTGAESTGGSRSQTASIAGDVFLRTETTTDTHLLVIDLADGRVIHEAHLQRDRNVHPGALGRSSLLLHDPEETTAVGLVDGTELWRTRHAFPRGGVLGDAVLLQVGHELLAVEHDPRAARRDPRGR